MTGAAFSAPPKRGLRETPPSRSLQPIPSDEDPPVVEELPAIDALDNRGGDAPEPYDKKGAEAYINSMLQEPDNE